MPIEFWLPFGLTVFVASMIPGPSTLLAFTHGATCGWRRALATAAGNALASTLQAIAASAGLGLVLTQSAVLFLVIKYLGAAYLIWLGIAMWRGARDSGAVSLATDSEGGFSGRLFSSGFLVAASNPKAIVFFTALFPQFLGTDNVAPGTLVMMVVLTGLIAFAVAAIYAGLGARVRAMQITRKTMARLHRLTGGLFVTGGIGLAMSRS